MSITTELADRILTIRFDRIDKKNALTQAMYGQLADAIEAGASNPEVRVILLAGQADCFTAGNDMLDFLNLPKDKTSNPIARFMHACLDLPKPMIAAVSGVAVGIGVTVLLHCDLVYCGENTKLSMPFTSLGICPEFGSSYLLPRIMGHQRAVELLMLGETFTAQKAMECGLVNQLLPNDQVETHARSKALKMAAMPPQALRVTKQLLRKWHDATLRESVVVEVDHFMPMLKQPEALEAITAFMQKRKPDFSRFN